MTRVAYLFPGQGTQKVGMGQYLVDQYPQVVKPLWDEADEVLGFPLSEMCMTGPAELLQQMPITQPAVFMISYATSRAARFEGLRPDLVAGHSLGEYAALTEAGVLNWVDALLIVRRRGELMAEVGTRVEGKMAVVVGCSRTQVEAACAEARCSTGGVVDVANHNEARQIVVSGHSLAVDVATDLLTRRGANRTTTLRVGGPAHSVLMAEAVAPFADHLREFTFHEPELPVISGSTADVLSDPSVIVAELCGQLTHQVRWVDVIARLDHLGVQRTVEIGSGKVLTKMLGRALPAIHASHTNDAAAFARAVQECSP